MENKTDRILHDCCWTFARQSVDQSGPFSRVNKPARTQNIYMSTPKELAGPDWASISKLTTDRLEKGGKGQTFFPSSISFKIKRTFSSAQLSSQYIFRDGQVRIPCGHMSIIVSSRLRELARQVRLSIPARDSL